MQYRFSSIFFYRCDRDNFNMTTDRLFENRTLWKSNTLPQSRQLLRLFRLQRSSLNAMTHVFKNPCRSLHKKRC